MTTAPRLLWSKREKGPAMTWKITVLLAVLANAAVAQAEEPGAARTESHFVASVLAGAGLGVALSGWALESAHLEKSDGGEFDSAPMMLGGIAVFATGVILRLISGDKDEDSADRSAAALYEDRNGWPLVVAVAPGECSGLAVAFRAGF